MKKLMLFLIILMLFGVFAPTALAWKFAVACDSRGSDVGVNTAVLGPIADHIAAAGVDLVLFPGDTTGDGQKRQLSKWLETMAPVYDAGIPVYPVRGNHEAWVGPSTWKRTFGDDVPDNGPSGEIDLTYYVEHENALFIGIDHYTGNGHIPEAWLNSLYASNTKPHIFVFGHEPAFKVDHTDCLDDVPAERDAFIEDLLAAGGKVYFCGHDHFLDILRADDGDGDTTDDFIQYIIGNAGAPLYNSSGYTGNNSYFAPVNIEYRKAYGYTIVEVVGSDVTLTHYDTGGLPVHVMSYSVAADPDVTAPTPDPMTWAVVPYAVDDSSISMKATDATDTETGVEYYFDEITGNPGGNDSGWQSGTIYTDTSLAPDTEYTYTVTARDTSGNYNETAASTAESATTDPATGCTATDMHIEAVVCAEVGGCSKGQKKGQVTVTIYDDCGNPVSGALVDVTFGGDYGETINDVATNGSGVAVITTSGCVKRPTWTVTVDDVTGSLPYDSNDNVTDNCSH